MRVNCNISAIIANNQLSKGQKALDKSIERLSSGYRINHAEDDAAGMAISNRMHTQIKALERAKNNSNDGVYVVQTAEGALSEVHNMLQRARELAVQAADATYSDEDRAAIQKEVEQILAEVDRVAETTEYNTMPLLDGTLGRRSYSDTEGVGVLKVNEGVSAGEYELTVTKKATKAVAGITEFSGTVPTGVKGSMSINGSIVKVGEGDDWDTVYERIVNACNSAGVDYQAGGILVNKYYGSKEELSIDFSNEEVANLFGYGASLHNKTAGQDCEIGLDAGFRNTATVSYDGKIATITDINNFKMVIEIDDDANVGDLAKLDVTDIGVMTLQIGANEGQVLDLDIPKLGTHILGIDDLRVGSTVTAGRAIEKLDAAISQVSADRARLGAYQNRLESTVESLSDYKLNMDSALSGIEDCDMAEEMTNYTAKNVLTQASTSVLAQANERPQTVLQLLQ